MAFPTNTLRVCVCVGVCACFHQPCPLTHGLPSAPKHPARTPLDVNMQRESIRLRPLTMWLHYTSFRALRGATHDDSLWSIYSQKAALIDIHKQKDTT